MMMMVEKFILIADHWRKQIAIAFWYDIVLPPQWLPNWQGPRCMICIHTTLYYFGCTGSQTGWAQNTCYVFIAPQLSPRMSPLLVPSFKLNLSLHQLSLSSATLSSVVDQCCWNPNFVELLDSLEPILKMKLKFHEKRDFMLHKYTENLKEAISKI